MSLKTDIEKPFMHFLLQFNGTKPYDVNVYEIKFHVWKAYNVFGLTNILLVYTFIRLSSESRKSCIQILMFFYRFTGKIVIFNKH